MNNLENYSEKDMEENISGFKVQGNWEDVVEHGERITAALQEADCSKEAFSEWNNWRPKTDEHIETEIREKTAKQAHTDKGSGEEAGQSPADDLLNAGEKLTDAYEHVEQDENNEAKAIDEWQRSLQYVARATDSAGRKVIRPVEDTIYKQVMTKMSPFYFDNGLVSANLQKKHNDRTELYVFEVNINNRKSKEIVRDQLNNIRNSYEYDEDTNESMTGIRMNCSSCGHRWIYDGNSAYYATCPNCNRSVRVKR